MPECCKFGPGSGHLGIGKVSLSTQQQTGTCFKSGKDKAVKGEGWALPYMPCPSHTALTATWLLKTYTFSPEIIALGLSLISYLNLKCIFLQVIINTETETRLRTGQAFSLLQLVRTHFFDYVRSIFQKLMFFVTFQRTIIPEYCLKEFCHQDRYHQKNQCKYCKKY